MSEKPQQNEVSKREVISTELLQELLTTFQLSITHEEIIHLHPDVTHSEFRTILSGLDSDFFNTTRYDDKGAVVGDTHWFCYTAKGFGHRFMKTRFDIRCHYLPVDQNPDGKITREYDDNDRLVTTNTTNYFRNRTAQKECTIFHLDPWDVNELLQYTTLRARNDQEPRLYGRHGTDQGNGLKLIDIGTILGINPYSMSQNSPYVRLGVIFDPITKDTSLVGFLYDGERVQINQFFEGKVDLYRIIQ